MNVLVACEESQEVCKAFRARGHRAFSCDIQECSGGRPEWHILGDVLPLLNGSCIFQTADSRTHTQEGRWDLIIAHPPCTFLTSAGSMRMFRIDEHGEKWINANRFEKMLSAAHFLRAFLDADCQKICVENPAPMHICDLPPYSQIIEPYQFGHPYKKRTCLWLRGLLPLRPTEIVEPTALFVSTGNGKTNRSILPDGKRRSAKERSKTFPGIARAMAEQWG